MDIKNKRFGTLLTGVFSALLWVASNGGVQAREAPGYTSDSSGNIITSGFGDCIRTGSWKPAKATIVGCDGVVVDAQVEVIEGQGTDAISMFVFPQAELFAFDSDVLSEGGKQYIAKYRKEVAGELAQAYSITIIGHTDSTGSADYNMGLSKRRAESVREFLASLDVPAEKMRTLGRGLKDPIASNDSDAGRAQNRRVEVIVVGQQRAMDAMIFPSVALFERRSAELTTQGKKLLEDQREKGRDQFRRAAYIEIVGHTDDVGDDQDNQTLSQRRAAAVRDYLVQTGMDVSMIVTVGAGERMPIASNATEEGRAENRRVEVLVLGRTR